MKWTAEERPVHRHAFVPMVESLWKDHMRVIPPGSEPDQYQKLVPTKPTPRMPMPTHSHTDEALPSVPGISPT